MAEDTVESQTRVPASTDQLVVVRDFIQATLQKTQMPERDARAVVLAVDEAIANTIEHGYIEDNREGHIDIKVQSDESRFCVIITDMAKEYNPVSDPSAGDLDMGDHVSAGKKRGLGLFIMRKVMDEVKYSYREGTSNQLTLVKYIKAES